MDTKQYMVIAKNKIITKDVESVRYDPTIKKKCVKFLNGKEFSYHYDNVLVLENPTIISSEIYHVVRNGVELNNIKTIYMFSKSYKRYFHIVFENGNEKDYLGDEVEILESALVNNDSKCVFDYLKTVAEQVGLKGDDGGNLLVNQYNKLQFLNPYTALSIYLNPKEKKLRKNGESIPIFPFGCNASQFVAVKNALDNQISVIEGPPGTGKTQTILNIISNLIIQNKTIAVVSNNNSATGNVLEKLEKYNMDFIVAALGNSNNKEEFIKNQTGVYPDISSWKNTEQNEHQFFEEIRTKSVNLGRVFEMQERVAIIKQEIESIKLEYGYFSEYEKETDRESVHIKIKDSVSSVKIMRLWQEFSLKFKDKNKIPFLHKLKLFLVYGINNFSFLSEDIEKINTFMQSCYYKKRLKELQTELDNLQQNLQNSSAKELADDLQSMSLSYVKSYLYKRYGNKSERRIFTSDALYKKPEEVQSEYPVVLSTTFSARSSLSKNVMFDYLIMDEASQVDVVTGALALSVAKNIVVVGDTKQLPNVVTDDVKEKLNPIFKSFSIAVSYNFSENSFLKSLCDLIPNVPKTLLREHYRCHPKIINFCNQKYYDNRLVIMTTDNGEDNVIAVTKTAEGFHSRGHMSQRQIDVIKEEVLPCIHCEDNEIGVIAPYNNQVGAMKKAISVRDIDVATVHKFQGREKDVIIMSTVDDEITDFTDDPYLLNVAVSRAKKKLHLVVSGNEMQKDGNIKDLISYIEYNSFTVSNSNIYSVFDYLYSHYSEARIEYLKKQKAISEYDSENLMYALICEVLLQDKFKTLKVAIHQQLNMIIRDPKLLDDAETAYAMNNWTHIDFLIYNSISKRPVLAVEVDGYNFHKEGTEQYKRDKMKEHILELYEIPWIRFSTNGSGEKEKLVCKLNEILN